MESSSSSAASVSTSTAASKAAELLGKLTTIKVLPDGSKQFTDKDGTVSIINPNGITVKQIMPDGTIIEINPDAGNEKKKTVKVNEDGEEEGGEDDDDEDFDIPKVLWLQKQTDPDGTVIEVYKNDIVVQILKDGSRVTRHPGGITHFDASTGDTRHRFLVSDLILHLLMFVCFPNLMLITITEMHI